MKLEVGLRAALRAFIGPVAFCSASPSTLSGPSCTCLPIAREFLTPCPFHRSKPTSLMLLPRSRRPSFRSATLHQRESRHRRRLPIRKAAAAAAAKQRRDSKSAAATQRSVRPAAAAKRRCCAAVRAHLRGAPFAGGRVAAGRNGDSAAARPRQWGPAGARKETAPPGEAGSGLRAPGRAAKRQQGCVLYIFLCACVRACVRACLRACLRARARVCVYVCARARALRHASCVS